MNIFKSLKRKLRLWKQKKKKKIYRAQDFPINSVYRSIYIDSMWDTNTSPFDRKGVIRYIDLENNLIGGEFFFTSDDGRELRNDEVREFDSIRILAPQVLLNAGDRCFVCGNIFKPIDGIIKCRDCGAIAKLGD